MEWGGRGDGLPRSVSEEKHSCGVSWGLPACPDMISVSKFEEGVLEEGRGATAVVAGWEGRDQKIHATVWAVCGSYLRKELWVAAAR